MKTRLTDEQIATMWAESERAVGWAGALVTNADLRSLLSEVRASRSSPSGREAGFREGVAEAIRAFQGLPSGSRPSVAQVIARLRSLSPGLAATTAPDCWACGAPPSDVESTPSPCAEFSASPGLASEPREGGEPHFFDKRAADALACEVAKLVDRGVIDARSPAGDALLDYVNPGPTESIVGKLGIAARCAPGSAPERGAPTLCKTCGNYGCAGDVDPADRAKCKTIAAAPERGDGEVREVLRRLQCGACGWTIGNPTTRPTSCEDCANARRLFARLDARPSPRGTGTEGGK